MRKNNLYFFSADVIRALAIMGVVAIHTANSVYQRPDFFGGLSWWFAIIIDSVSRVSIPLFIMLSGFLLLRKMENFSITFQRIVNRLVVPLVFWTAISSALSNTKNVYTVFSLDFLLRFFTGNVYSFYFLVILIGLYFASPLFIAFLKNENIYSQKILAISLIIIGLLETAASYLDKNCANENLFTKWVPYAGLFLFGYLVGTGRWKVKNSHWIWWNYMVGLVVTLVFNYIYFSGGSITVLRTLPPGCLSQYSDYYLSFNVVLMSLSAFMLLFNFKYTYLKNTIFQKIIYQISRASFGIYLVNLSVVAFWDKGLNLDVDNVKIPLWSYIILKFFVVFLISYLLSTIIRKMPIIKRTIGETD